MKTLLAARPHNVSRVLLCASTLLALYSLLAVVAVAQSKPTDGSTPLGLQAGAPEGSYSLSGFDNVNLYDGALNFHLPLLGVGGRGGAGHSVLLSIERHWMAEYYDDGQGNYFSYPVDGREEEVKPGYGPGVMAQRYGGTAPRACPTPVGGGYEQQYRYTTTLTRLSFTSPDGTEVEFRDQTSGGQGKAGVCQSYTGPPVNGFDRGTVFVSVDGSAATFVSDAHVYDQAGIGVPELHTVAGYMLLRDGTRYRIDGGLVSWIRDRNGNLTTFTHDANSRVTSIKDSLNRVVTIAYDVAEGGLYGTCDRIGYKGFGGADRVIRVSKTNLGNALRAGYALTTPAYLFPGLQGSNYTNYNPTVVSSVWLPDGDGVTRRYRLYYNNYGELARVELPTGGAYEYDYGAGTTNGGTGGVIFLSGVKPQIYRRAVERRVYADGVNLTSRMTYSVPETETVSGCCSVATTGYVVTSQYDLYGALLASSSHYLYGTGAANSLLQGPLALPFWENGKETQIDSYDTNGTTVLRRSLNVWQVGTPISTNPSVGINGRVSEVDITVEPSGANKVSKQTFAYDQYNNQTDVYDYDYGTGAAGSLLRRTHTDYLVTNPVNATDYTTTSIHIRSLPTQISVYDANGVEKARTTFEYDNYTTDANHAALTSRSNISGLDASYTASYQKRGNTTGISRYILPAGTAISSYSQYDVAGNVVKAIDARGYATTLDFSDRFGSPDGEAQSNTAPTQLSGQTSFAMVTKVTNALGHISYTQFDYYTGRAVNGEDVNGIVTSGYYNDVLDRATQLVSGVGTSAQRQASFSYDDVARVVTTTSDISSYGDNLLKSKTLYDNMGRTFEARRYESSTNYIATQRGYDALGRANQVSNPFRPWNGETPQWTTTQFDALGRTKKVTTPDTAYATTSYNGYVVTATDQAGKQRTSQSSALGWVTSVTEAPNDLNYNYQTSYQYDVLGNLTTVTQGGQTRTFAYDSLSRSVSATNPESGTVTCQYDSNGNVIQRTDARNITTVYSYDALNRPTSKTYQNDPNGTPVVNFYYDSQTLPTGAPAFDRGYSTGMLVAVTYGGTSAGTYGGFDAMGRTVRQYQQTDGVNYLVEAIYNKAGGTTSQTYPSVPGYADRRTVTYSYDGAARLSAFTSGATSFAASANVSSIGYASQGMLSTETLGNGLVHSVTYNNRLQPGQITLGTSGSPSSVMSLVYDYGTTNNNGNMLGVNYTGGGLSYTQTFFYDSLNRLTTAQENSGSSWSQTNGYDRYGNRWVALGGGSQSLYFNAANNRISGWGYDASGNLSNDFANNYSYDAESRLKMVNGVTAYAYDGAGRRVRKYLGENTRFVYGIGGELLAEYDGSSGALRKEYLYGAGGIVTVEPGAGAKYAAADNLGTPRVVTNAAGAVVSRHDYKPFGEELSAGTGGRTPGMGYGASDNVRQHFTGQQRDAETGLDFFNARYYASTQGRFTSPDPFNGSARATDPQTLNRYTYVTNNPLVFSDPSGMASVHAAMAAVHGGDMGAVFAGENYTAEDEARYESNLAATWEAVAEADAINGMLRAGLIDNETAAAMAADNPMLEAATQKESPAKVVDATEDKSIKAALSKMSIAEKGSTPQLADVKVLVGETQNVTDVTYRDPYGVETAHFSGTIRVVAYVPLDKDGKIIPDGNGIGVKEIISENGGPLKMLPPDGERPKEPAKGGVFYDTQLILRGQPLLTVRQAVHILQYSRDLNNGDPTSHFVIGTNKIVMDAAAGTIAITIDSRPARRVP